MAEDRFPPNNPAIPKPIALVSSEDEFRRLQVARQQIIFELDGSRPLSDLRDVTRASGNAAVTAVTDDAEYRVRHSGANGAAALFSAERGRYVPGQVAEPGIGARIEGTISGDSFAEFGYFEEKSDNTVRNGFLIGKDADGTYVRVVRGGVERVKKYRTDRDAFQAVNSSWEIGQKGVIYQFPFLFYGYGPVHFEAFRGKLNRTIAERALLYHWTEEDRTILTNPNLHVGGRVGGSSTDDFSLYIGGRKFTTIGDLDPVTRFTPQSRATVTVDNSGLQPLISFRNKGGKWRGIQIATEGIDLNVASADAEVIVLFGGTLTTPTWISPTYVSSEETAVEFDVSASAVTGGQAVAGFIVPAGTNRSPEGINLSLPNLKVTNSVYGSTICTIAAVSLEVTDADITPQVKVEESW